MNNVEYNLNACAYGLPYRISTGEIITGNNSFAVTSCVLSSLLDKTSFQLHRILFSTGNL